jgi:hypothetical protein
MSELQGSGQGPASPGGSIKGLEGSSSTQLHVPARPDVAVALATTQFHSNRKPEARPICCTRADGLMLSFQERHDEVLTPTSPPFVGMGLGAFRTRVIKLVSCTATAAAHQTRSKADCSSTVVASASRQQFSIHWPACFGRGG